MRQVLLISLFFIPLCSLAQGKWAPIDTVRNYTNISDGGFRMGLDGYHSFISGVQANVVGFRYGLNYGKVGVYSGYYTTNAVKSSVLDTQIVNLSYISTTIEYYIHQSWRFEVVVPIRIGYGLGVTTIKSATRDLKTGTDRIVPLEIGIGGSVRFLRYMGFAAGLGLRIGLLGDLSYSTPYYYGNFTIFTGTIYRDLKKVM